MGYSCSAKASYVMDVIMEQNRHENSGNVYKSVTGDLYFWERGRENADGAMTGPVHKFLPGDRALKVGSYRINRDGRIERFPGLDQNQRQRAERAGLHKFDLDHMSKQDRWQLACQYDAVDPSSMFVAFSPANPYA